MILKNNKKRNMKNISKKYLATLLSVTLAASTLYGCKEDDGRADVNIGAYKWLGITQSRDAWDGQDNNMSMKMKETDKGDTVITLNTSLYMNQNADKDCKADIVVNTDSLKHAITLASTGGNYAIYANAVIMPEDAYSFSSKEITLKSGQKKSDGVSLTIHRAAILSNPLRNDNPDAVFVLPVSIANSSVYKINDKVSTLMIFISLPKQDPTMPDETSPKTELDGMKLVWDDEL